MIHSLKPYRSECDLCSRRSRSTGDGRQRTSNSKTSLRYQTCQAMPLQKLKLPALLQQFSLGLCTLALTSCATVHTQQEHTENLEEKVARTNIVPHSFLHLQTCHLRGRENICDGYIFRNIILSPFVAYSRICNDLPKLLSQLFPAALHA